MSLSVVVDLRQERRLEERFQQVVEGAPYAMVVIDSSGKRSLHGSSSNAQAPNRSYHRAALSSLTWTPPSGTMLGT